MVAPPPRKTSSRVTTAIRLEGSGRRAPALTSSRVTGVTGLFAPVSQSQQNPITLTGHSRRTIRGRLPGDNRRGVVYAELGFVGDQVTSKSRQQQQGCECYPAEEN